mgnify:FL=1
MIATRVTTLFTRKNPKRSMDLLKYISCLNPDGIGTPVLQDAFRMVNRPDLSLTPNRHIKMPMSGRQNMTTIEVAPWARDIPAPVLLKGNQTMTKSETARRLILAERLKILGSDDVDPYGMGHVVQTLLLGFIAGSLTTIIVAVVMH